MSAESNSITSSIRGIAQYVILGGLGLAFAFACYKTGQVDRLIGVIVTVAIAIFGSAAIFIGLNRMLDLARSNWVAFNTCFGALAGLTAGGLLRGNRLATALVAPKDSAVLNAGSGILGNIEWPVVLALFGAALGAVCAGRFPRSLRIAISVAIAAICGLLVASKMHIWFRPKLPAVALIVWVAIALGAAWLVANTALKREKGRAFAADRELNASLMSGFTPKALVFAGLAVAIATWLFSPSLSGGNFFSGLIATALPLMLVAAGWAYTDSPSPRQLVDFDRRARAFVFLAPALSFLFAALVVPALRTIWLSFLDRESVEFVGFKNYGELFSDPASLDLSNWTNIFTSQLFLVGMVLIVAGIAVGVITHNTRNKEFGFEKTTGSVGASLIGLFVLSFAVLSTLRGTFINNIWWVVTVTALCTVLGLVFAVLSEQAGKLESVAKGFVFMPMAISFVGASIVWRYQYQARNITKKQTGVLNAVWIELGKLSHSGLPRMIALALLAVICALLIWRGLKAWQAGTEVAGTVAVFIVFGYLFVELFRRSLGGFAFSPNGDVIADTVLFRETAPFNNVFLMIILIWIQTGFAMVILSAAIKAVPAELLEAARIDGADASAQFFRVTLPQILPTLGVVITTLIVLVTKVFDIVKVSTGGNFGTNVLANDMYTVAFTFFDRGKGSAIAVLILVTVLPVLIFNVYSMQKEEA